ncbi:MAG: cytochrome c biogenesis protein ResB [Gemmataceae bacterium]
MSITTDPRPAAPAPRGKERKFEPLDAVRWLASLQLTVWLFVLSFLLVFFGTLAQIDFGIWTVVRDYFRSFVVFIPFNVFAQFSHVFLGLPKEWRFGGAFPFPGGWTLAILLMANLLSAHFVRFKLTWKRAGILVLHAGLIVMLTGEIITGLYAVEGNMTIEEGETAAVVTDNRVCELAVVDPSDDKTDTVTTVPRWMLQRTGRVIKHDALPFDVVPVQYMGNSALDDAAKKNPADAGAGKIHIAVEKAEGSGVAADQIADAPSVYVKLVDKATGQEMGTYLFSIHLSEQEIKVGDKTYEVSLRFRQTQRPFSLTLKKFSFDRYPGTDTPLNFASLVRLKDEARGDDREVLIRMNEPLRHAGETFYQANWNKKTERGTVLQVVRNPAWQLPYWSCGIVTLGLLMHFGVSLVEFLNKRGA